ncbi:anoctamin-10 isoform X2 [Condylostylus longicornis]|uniref:anoctamin-10 isoform X2 n=1 Tax=Condylostylus longicornis TaxID=2530218 RepID=UPI00244DE733|nr:anoctamin-10 isoform X2 [Condylostylus longicornis]
MDALNDTSPEILLERPGNPFDNKLIRRQISMKRQAVAKSRSAQDIRKFGKTYIVIAFSEKAKIMKCQDIEKIIQEFGMTTYLEQVSKYEKYLYISAPTDVLLKLADENELMKKTITGTMQKFSYYSKSDFLIDGLTEETLLRNSEIPVLIKNAIKPSLKPYIRNGIIEHFFALHDLEYLDKFCIEIGKRLPIQDIRNYFGTTIGLYFAFIEFYTKALLLPTIFGIFQYIFNFNLATVCGFYVLWTTVFSELWKRKCSGLAYRWGTIEMTSLDRPRSAYYGDLKPDPITGKLTLQYPIAYTYLQMYCISYPVVFVCVILAAYFALYQFQIEAEVLHDFGPDSWLNYVPVIVQSMLIAIFSWAYEKLATFLTDQENHRTRSQYDRHRVTKLMIFEIVNNFFSLFYIAFVLQDLVQLKYQLMMQLIIFQLVQIFQELGFPLIAVIKQKYTKFTKNDTNIERNVENLLDPVLYEQIYFETALDEYQSTYEDYLQITTQFGYVVLFAAVAPFAALGALINNVAAMYIDIYKLIYIYKRPFARRAKNIGAWQVALDLLSVMALLSNCGILYLQPNVRDFVDNLFPNIQTLSFVIFEHFLLGVKYCIHKIIHEKPRWVRIAMAKSAYESAEALKNLRKMKSD